MKNIAGINEKNRRLLESLNRFGENIFSVKDAARIMDLPVENARLYLSYFARRGWLSRVKQGLYIAVPLGTVNPQEYKENPWVVADRVFAPYYIGGWSAAEYWDLTEQIFNSIYVFTSKPFRCKNINIQGTDFVLKFLGENTPKYVKGVWIEHVKIMISEPTQTIVDVLDDPSAGGGIRHVSDIIENYFNSEHKNEERLLECIKEKGNRTAYKRLGFILEGLNIPAVELKKICLNNISRGYSTFDPSVKNKGTYNSRWNLRVNTEIR